MLDTEVVAAKAGNKEIFVRLIKECEPTMYRIAKALLNKDTDCADAIQETILKAYESIHSLREPSFFKTWLIRILINESKRIKLHISKVIPFEEIQPQYQTVKDEHHYSEIKDMLEFLDDDLRLTVILFYVEDQPLKEIAEVMKVPEGTVKSRLYLSLIHI